jgi:hypothetical protein
MCDPVPAARNGLHRFRDDPGADKATFGKIGARACANPSTISTSRPNFRMTKGDVPISKNRYVPFSRVVAPPTLEMDRLYIFDLFPCGTDAKTNPRILFNLV